jgi:hypothetical protein
MKPRLHLVVAAAFMLFSACSNGPQPDARSAPGAPVPVSEGPTDAQTVRFSPPPLSVASDTGDAAELQPIAYCWSGPDVALCADGDPWQFEQPDLSGSQTFTLEWPLDGWSWTIVPRAVGGACGTVLPVLEGRVAGQPISAPSGGDLMFVEGSGPEGEVTYAFTPHFTAPAGAFDRSATVSFVSSSDAATASDLAVHVTNLAQEPSSLSAAAFIQGAEGRIAVIELDAAAPDGCFTGAMTATLPAGAGPADLIGFVPPIEVSIDLTIEGVVHRSDPVTWPEDFGPTSPVSPALTFRTLGG